MKFSKLSILGAFLALLPTQSSALKCGIKGVTEPCIGETDDRYNPDVSYNLKDQNDLWKKKEGLTNSSTILLIVRVQYSSTSITAIILYY